LLNLSLKYMFSIYPENHWVTRQNLLASTFFIFDTILNRLRLTVEREYHQYQRLHKQLYKDILERKTVKLASHLWPHILQAPSIEPSTTPDGSFLCQINLANQLREYNSNRYRQTGYEPKLSLEPSCLSNFWKSSMLFLARSMWYRLVIKKLPTRLLIHQMGHIDTPKCLLCDEVENWDHLLVGCSVRWEIWEHALGVYYLVLSFTQSDVLQSLQLFSPPFSILGRKRFYTILPTIQWFIWWNYWNYVFDQQLICNSTIIRIIISQISVLLSPPSSTLE
ncbi:hypothetical protein BC941DRAFT_363508, partial [Chlamydoabsidia padenii]